MSVFSVKYFKVGSRRYGSLLKTENTEQRILNIGPLAYEVLIFK
jgi:hypothetical protein